MENKHSFLSKRFSACSGMDSTKALNISKLANYDTVNQDSKMTQPNNHRNRKFEEEKENPNKSMSKPKAFINGSVKNSGVKLKDIKEELEKMTTTGNSMAS